MADSKHVDEVSGVETTGHVWDGIRELNNPLPRWWLWTFYATIVFAIVYTILYPAWPLVSGATPGLLGWHSRATFDDTMKTAEAAQAVYLKQIAATPVEDIARNPDLEKFATAAGAASFKVNCSPCHGSGATGGVGYPNLNDDDWLWGGKITDIYTTILHGIRYDADPDTRMSQMPAFGHDGILTPAQVSDVAWYVVTLSGGQADQTAAGRGKEVYAANCAACHGDQGQGGQDFGAPRLSDPIWLYKPGYDAIVAQVTNPQHGVMPAWSARLGDTTVKELAVFVHSLGGGK